MDYYSMKRRELQALCKEHNIPASSANSVMADKLSQLLNEKQKPTTRQRTCLKSPVETQGVGEPAVSKRAAKKVRFSPNNGLVEYELRSEKKQKDVVAETRGRRKSMANKVDKQVVNDNHNTAELINDGAQISVKLTRSRVQVSGKDGVIPNNEKKQGRKAAKDVGKVTEVVKEPEGNLGKVTRSKVHTLNKGAVQLDETKQSKREVKDVEKVNELVEGTVVGRVRVTRSKAQSLMEDGMGSDVNPQLKKSSGRQVANDAESVELSREITDIPVRVTRTRGHILKEDIGNTVTNPQGEKKRTSKEMKSTDLRSNLSNVAQDDNQKLPKRKSLRTRGSETTDKDEAEKLGRGKQKKKGKESVAESQHHADKGLRQLRRDVAKVEDSKVLNKNVSKVEVVNDRKVTRSKHKKESKLLQKLEEPPDHREKKVVNRRKFVMQKAKGKGIDKPLVGKRESVEATVMVVLPTRETRKTVGKTRSKEQSGNQSLIDEDLEDIEDVTRSGKDAENEMKAVVDASGSTKSRKRRGTPVVENQPIDTQYDSPVDESPKHSAPSSSKGEAKSVAKKQVDSNLKTSASRKKTQFAVENAFLEVDKENSSKKRAKLSETNQTYSENRSEKSNIKGTPVCKLGIFKLEEVTETESTPANEFHRRATRSAIKTVGKEPSQSAIKEYPIADAQFSSRKGARFRPDLAVNTAPGRVTRSGIKHGGRAAIIFSEKVDKKKQLSQSALRKQALDNTQISSPEGAEIGLTPNVDTIGVQSEISKETTGHILEHLDDLSASESVKLPTIVLEENMVSMIGNAIVMENLSPVSGEIASGVESVTMAEKPEVFETTPDTISDGSHVQNETQEVAVKSTILSEAEVPLHLEKPVAYETEMDLTKLGSTSKGLQIDLMAEEPVISVDKTVVMEENVDILYEAGSSAVCHVSVEQIDVKGKSKEMEDQVEPSIIENVKQFIEDDVCYAQIAKGSEQDDLTCKDSLQNDSVDKHEVADNGERDDDDENATVQKPLMNEPVSEDRGVADGVDAQEMDESDNKELDDIITSGPSVTEHGGELSTGKSVVNCLAMDRSGVTVDVAVAGNDPTKKIKFEVVLSTDNDVHEVPILGESDSKEAIVSAAQSVDEHGEMSTGNDVHENHNFGGSDNKEDIASAGQGVAEHGELSTGNDVHEIPILGESDNKEDIVSSGQSVAEHGEMSTGVHEIPSLGESDNKEDIIISGQTVAKHGELSTGKNVIYDFSIDRSDVVDAGKGPTKKVEFEVVAPSTGNDVHEVPILGNSDGEDEGVNATKEGEIDSMLSTDGDMVEDPVLSGIDGEDDSANAIDCDTDSLPSTTGNRLEDSVLRDNDGEDESAKATDCQIDSLLSTGGNMIVVSVLSGSDSEAESNPKLLTDHDVSGTSLLGKDDYNINRQLEPTLEPSPADDIIEGSFSDNDIYDGAETDGGINVSKELETGLEPSNVPVSINDVNRDFENDRLTGNVIPAMEDHNVGGEDSEPAPNENKPVVTEVSIRSCEQEPEQVCNVTADEVPCDTIGICASVGPSYSSTSIEAPHTYAIPVDPLEESILDTNKEAVSNILGDTYDTDTENDNGNEQKFTELDEGVQPKESESFPPDTSKEQTSEKAEMETGNDHALNDQEENTVATVDLDLDGGKFMEDCSNHGVDELDSEFVGIINANENPTREETSPIMQTKEEPTVDGVDSSQLMGDIGAHESLITKGSSPITYTNEEYSDSPTFFKEDDVNKQEETRTASTTVDWGDYSFALDEYHNPVTANESDDELDQSKKEFQTSVGASSSSEENSRVAADMVNSVKNVEMASRNVANEKSNQEVDMLKENMNADTTEEVFNWPDSSLKSLHKTPVSTQLSHVKDGQEEGVSFSNQDHYSSLKYFFKTPATTRIGHVEYGQENAVDFSNLDHSTARISHVKDDEEDAGGSFTFLGDRCNKDIAKNRTATHEFDHQWQFEQLGVFDGETQGNATTHSSENVTYGVPNIEDYSHKFFGDEVDDPSDGSGKNTHFELKGDHVDQTKHFDLSSQAVGTSRHQASGNSIYSDEL